MSHKAMNQVMDCCSEQGGEREVLLALAWRADDHGRRVWYDTERIAFEARMSVRNVQRHLASLLSSGRVVLEIGAAPQGGDFLHLNLPSAKFTREMWSGVREIRNRGKRQGAKTRRVKKDDNLSHPEPGENCVNLSPFFPLNPSLLSDKLASNLDKLSSKNVLPLRADGLFSDLYCPCTVLKDNVIQLDLDAREAASELQQASSPDLAQRENNFFLEEEEKIEFEPAGTPENELPEWSAEDFDLLFGGQDNFAPEGPEQNAPDGAAPDGAGGGDETSAIPSGTVSGRAKNVTLTASEKVPGGAAAFVARRKAQPGDAVYETLKARCGGSAREPLLLKYLGEYTPAGHSRHEWLRLTAGEVDQSIAQGHVEVTEGRAVKWVYGFLRALDLMVDFHHNPAAPAPAAEPSEPLDPAFAPENRSDRREAGSGRVHWESAPRPGDGDNAPRKLLFRVGARVSLHGRLGVVIGAFSDARQAAYTVDFDDGERESFTGGTVGALRDVLDRQAPPPPAGQAGEYPIGSQWLVDGKLHTVSAVGLKIITTDQAGQQREWLRFGALTLAKIGQRVTVQGAGQAAS